MHDREISIAEAAKRRDVRLLDIRPRSERWSGVGVIPGSVSPRGELAQEIKGHLDIGVTVVLCCLTGRRSLDQAVEYDAPSVLSLSGGLLAWQAAGFASLANEGDINHIATSEAAPPQLGDLKRALVSCFVAEVVETAEIEVDPMRLLHECFDLLHVDADNPTVGELLLVVEWAAARSRELGNDYDRIAENVSMFVAEMQPLATAVGG